MNALAQQPIIIIGAPRSGTNMLRDLLVSFDDVQTWPCDEINYIWRYGNVRYPSDEFPEELATDRTVRYIRQHFEALGRRQRARIIVEKTCANSLRVPFVDRVIPEARYVFIRRDGLDVVGSAMDRWTAPLDVPYLLRKARYVPAADLPYYAGRYLWARLYRLFSSEERLAFWGPQLSDMDSLLKKHNLLEVCALQWQRCVERSYAAFSAMPPDRWLEVSYEDLVQSPTAELPRILDFMECEASSAEVARVTAGVRTNSVGKVRRSGGNLGNVGESGSGDMEQVEALIANTLNRFGYAVATAS